MRRLLHSLQRRVLMGVPLLLLIAACSAPQVTYNRLDWLASWQLGKYLSLNAEQQHRFDANFEALWRWHRETELARYASDLREMAASAAEPQSAVVIDAWVQRMDSHWQRLLEKLVPEACPHLRSLSDKQVQSVLRRMDRNLADSREEYVEPGPVTAREDAGERLFKTLRRWIGELDEAQLRELAQWSATRELDYAGWIDRRRLWRERFGAALARRAEPGFCLELDSLFGRPRPPRVPSEAAARAAWINFVARFSATLSAKQREHLRSELLSLADDFDALATQRRDQ